MNVLNNIICRYLILIGFSFFLQMNLFADPYDLSMIREGDVLFQETVSSQARALKLVTKSRYTHVGIAFKSQRRMIVYEAVQPVKKTNIHAFIKRGKNRHFVVKRLKMQEQLLNTSVISRIKKKLENHLGKKYDIYFNWSDKELYCTELVWKVYYRTLNVKLGRMRPLKDFDLSHPFVRKIMVRRYGNNIPLDEKMISVSEMFDSQHLKLVYSYN